MWSTKSQFLALFYFQYTCCHLATSSENMTSYHLYVDDTQLYLSFDSCMPPTSGDATIQLESYIAEIRAWMLTNKLKLNGDNTDFLQLLPNTLSKNADLNITLHIGSDSGNFSSQAKNLGVTFDSGPPFITHITSMCCFSRIKKYLTSDALKTAVHALISSKIDFCNSQSAGLPAS